MSYTLKVPTRSLENNPLSSLWIDKCTIYEYQPVTNPTNYQTTHDLIAVVKDEPCRLSYHKEQSTNITNGAAVISQSITLFIRPDLIIKEGSVIDITRHGAITRYKGSGKPAIYTNHQEIILELYEENA